MPPTATFTIDRPAPGVAVVATEGELDVYSAPDLRDRYVDLINEAVFRQVFDLSAVTRIDSTGLGVIVGALKGLRNRGGGLALVAPFEATDVRRALTVTGLAKSIPHAETVDGALELLAPKPEPRVAPSPSVIAAQILHAQVRDLARGVFRDQIEARLDVLADCGEIRGLDEDALLALAGAVEWELAAAADEGRITVTITEPTP